MYLRAVVCRLALAASPLALTGCFLAAAGAGAAGAIAYTNRGASSNVSGSVDQVFDRALSAFQQSGITETGRSTEKGGDERSLTGKKGDYEVTVELDRSSDSVTKVEVIAKKSPVEYDKEMAKEVLNRILAR